MKTLILTLLLFAFVIPHASFAQQNNGVIMLPADGITPNSPDDGNEVVRLPADSISPDSPDDGNEVVRLPADSISPDSPDDGNIAQPGQQSESERMDFTAEEMGEYEAETERLNRLTQEQRANRQVTIQLDDGETRQFTITEICNSSSVDQIRRSSCINNCGAMPMNELDDIRHCVNLHSNEPTQEKIATSFEVPNSEEHVSIGEICESVPQDNRDKCVDRCFRISQIATENGDSDIISPIRECATVIAAGGEVSELRFNGRSTYSFETINPDEMVADDNAESLAPEPIRPSRAAVRQACSQVDESIRARCIGHCSNRINTLERMNNCLQLYTAQYQWDDDADHRKIITSRSACRGNRICIGTVRFTDASDTIKKRLAVCSTQYCGDGDENATACAREAGFGSTSAAEHLNIEATTPDAEADSPIANPE